MEVAPVMNVKTGNRNILGQGKRYIDAYPAGIVL